MKAFFRALLRLVVLRVLRVRTTYSKHNIELLRQGGVVVCANHVSLLDGVIVALSSPVPLVFGVDTDFSRRSWGCSRGLAVLAFLGFGRVVSIDAKSPFGIRALHKALASGESVMVFPEGRISEAGGSLPEQPGIEWLCQRTQALIVRVRISGAENSRLFAKSGRALLPAIKVSF